MEMLHTREKDNKKLTKYWKISFLATKSVSQLSSITTALVSFWAKARRPSAAVREDFFRANTFPLFRSSVCAASVVPTLDISKWNRKQKKVSETIHHVLPISQLQSMRAALTSLMGALVLSLSCFMRLIWSDPAGASTLNLLNRLNLE